MNNLLLPLGRFFSRWSVKKQLLTMLVVIAIISLMIIGLVSYQRSAQQTVDESRQWAAALAVLAAHASAGPLLELDYGTLDSSLQEIVALPGVKRIQVVRPGGLLLLTVDRSSEGGGFVRPEDAVALEPPASSDVLEGQRITAYASLLPSNRAVNGQSVNHRQLQREGWVEVKLAFDERLAASQRHWLQAFAGASLMVALTLYLFYLFLNRAIRPIRELARFSTRLANAPGETLRMRWGSQEVRELGRALNWSSKELERQMSATQQRLSRLRAILDTAADAIIGVRQDGIIDSANPTAERMFGRSAEQLNGCPLSEVLVNMDTALLQETMSNGMLIHSTQSRIGRLEINALRHGGTAFPVEVLLGEIPDDQDIRYTCIVRDLTDMKQAEEYLTLYGRVVDCTLNGICISDARRYPQPIVHINPAFSCITGYAPHELLGRDASILEGPLTDPSDLARLAQTVQAGGEATLTLKNYRKDGQLFHNKLSVSPVKDVHGEITHYINVIEDVSQQVEVKQRLIERTARLNATFDLSPDGFVVFDSQGALISSNPAFREMVGEIPSWCSLQRFDVWFKNLCEEFDDYLAITASWHKQKPDVIALARPSRKVIEREIRRNLGGSGETILYFRDITHQTEVDRIKSDFLATAAHELRTPLASILGFTELMIHRKYSEEKQKDLLRTVYKQGTLLSGLIQELLDLSRIEARQGKDFHIVPMPLRASVADAVAGIASFDKTREVQVGEVPEVRIMADASKLQQALTNLLSNAFKYSPNGGQVCLDAELETAPGQEPVVAIHIRDQGLGMTPDQVERAFERFYRADTSGNIPGTGLGLNLVKEIAEIQGGSVSLQSEFGVGTVATLRMRLADPLEQRASASTQEAMA